MSTGEHEPSMIAPAKRSFFILVIVAWFAGISLGLWSIERYKSIAGRASATPAQAFTTDPHGIPRRPRLLMFLHPHCPCTRASLSELASIVARNPKSAMIELFVVEPPGADDNWGKSKLSTAAAAIPGALVRHDDHGKLAQQLGVQTSGHVILYDPHGKLLFSGGITRSRGHEGDNAGSRSVTALLQSRAAERSTTPVFGCPLLGDSKCCIKTGDEACPVQEIVGSR